MRWLLLLVLGCASAPGVVSQSAVDRGEPLWVVASLHSTRAARVSLLDETGSTVGTWSSEAPGRDGVHRFGGVSSRPSGGSLRLEIEDEVVRVPLGLRGDERAIVIEHRGDVTAQLWVSSPDVRLASENEGLSITNHGRVAIGGLGLPAGWFQAMWLFAYDDGSVIPEPKPAGYCATGAIPVASLQPGETTNAGDSPWAMGVGERIATHVMVPFVASAPEIDTGVDAGVAWSVARLYVAELIL